MGSSRRRRRHDRFGGVELDPGGGSLQVRGLGGLNRIGWKVWFVLVASRQQQKTDGQGNHDPVGLHERWPPA